MGGERLLAELALQLLAENAKPGAARVRSSILLGRDASAATVVAMTDFVTATGGGYFFSPSIGALETVLGA